MKIITLNIWGGRVYEPLIKFLEDNKNIDVFCFQEVYHEANGKEVLYTDASLDIFKKIKDVLPEYNSFYRPCLDDYYGLAAFTKKSLNILEEEEIYVHKHKGYKPSDHVGFHAKNVQYIKILNNGKEVSIFNFHGLWNGQGKTDTEDRINQSQNVKKFMDSKTGEKILCGDFNLLPDTKSLSILENGMRNLIKDYGIESTRTSFYPKPIKFADYVLVSPGIEVKDFKVLPEEVSDHSALYLEFSN